MSKEDYEDASLIGNYKPQFSPFPETADLIRDFRRAEFRKRSSIERNHLVNQALLHLIQAVPTPCFLLWPVIDFMDQVTRNEILDGPFNLTAFERYLNQHAGLSAEANRLIRGKIVGKYLPRGQYQTFFPIGHDTYLPYSHCVTAHNPPDLDSTTASFIGWLDAFGCRVGTALTVWNVPGGVPDAMISRMFEYVFGEHLFERLAKFKTTISPVAMDLVSQEHFIRVAAETTIRDFQHNRNENHIILVDEQGFYKGDWRVSDVDSVGRIQRLLNMILHNFEKRLVRDLTGLFAKPAPTRDQIAEFVVGAFERSLTSPKLKLVTFTRDDLDCLDRYLKLVLGFAQGGEASVGNFFEHMDRLAGSSFGSFRDTLTQLLDEANFDGQGRVSMPTALVFDIFHQAFESLAASTFTARNWFDRMDVAIGIKHLVLGHSPSYVTTKADVSEIIDKIKDHQHVTVIFPDKSKRLVPVGVIHRDQLKSACLGTVSLRDFCNRDEINLSPNVEVVAAVDHHRSALQSKRCMTVSIADVQSVNVILAEKAVTINDLYSLRGQSELSLTTQLQACQLEDSAVSMRLQERLLRKRNASARVKQGFFVAPEREFIEYLLMLNAIVDDTDLFSKCGWRDLEAIAAIVNRMKSIVIQEETEVLDLSRHEMAPDRLRTAIGECLANPDVRSFYRTVMRFREDMTAEWIKNPAQVAQCFIDRKVQNECCLVSQLKMFTGNIEIFNERRADLAKHWLELVHHQRQRNTQLELFIHMNSTVPSADGGDDSSLKKLRHRDELWVTADMASETAVSRLRQFINAFKSSPRFSRLEATWSLAGPAESRSQMAHILQGFFKDIKITNSQRPMPQTMLIISCAYGTINSRKADVTPFLPTP